MDIFFLIIGLAGLWLASEIAISGALDIADHYRVSRTFVGLTVLAIGTDVPEVFVNVSAAVGQLRGTPASGFIVGQTMGSNMALLWLMLGLGAVVSVFTIEKRKLLRDGGMMLAAAFLTFLLGIDGGFSRSDGLLMITVYLIYFGSLVREEKVRDKIAGLRSRKSLVKATLSLIGGLGLLAYSAEMTVSHSLSISQEWGVAQSVIGALIVGLGTSLPEFAASAMALRMGQGELALGNMIGSAVFNSLMALGIAATIGGLPLSPTLLYVDVLAVLAASAVVLAMLWRRLRIGRAEGLILVSLYVCYFVLKIYMSS